MTEEPRSHFQPLKIVAGRQHDVGNSDNGMRDFSHAEPSIPDLDWTILMARAQDGDASAYLRLLEAITPYLRSLAARRHRDQRDIEDAVQDVLLTVHSIRHTYDPARPFGPWLVAIANRRFIDRLRRQGRVKANEVSLTAAHQALAEPRANMDAKPDRHKLESAIDTLAPTQQQAIRLLKLKEMSLKEAAMATGMSIASLKVATHRALKNLRKKLADWKNI